jgi:peptidoglycan/LPS O-acetylase OafA/YrhL
MTEPRAHIATLDGLRGVAAAAVVWYHMTIQVHMTTPLRGYLAVDFFFILSGLVVAGAYEDRLRNNMTFGNFVKIRLIRLYPLIVLGTLLGFVSKFVAFSHFTHGGSGSLSHIFIAVPFGLLLLPYSGMYGVNRDMFPLDTPLWSLMFEIWANIFYAAIVRFGAVTAVRALTICAVVLGAGALIPCAWLQHGLSGGHSVATLWTGVARVTFSFFMGVALHRGLTAARVAALPSLPFPLLAVLLLLALSAGRWFGPFYDVFAVLVIFPAIVMLGVKDRVSPGWRPAALFAGALSYPLYALHDATFVHFSHFQNHAKIELLAIFVLTFILTAAVSYIAMRYYDEPVRRWLSRATRSVWPAAAQIVTPAN